MSDVAQPTRQALAARDRSLPGKVTGRLKVALDAMVWSAATRPQAAVMAKMSDHSLRQALKRPHVMAHYLRECETLRLSGRSRRLHRLEQLAEQDRNVAGAVAAIRAAEQIGEDAVRDRAMTIAPGLAIVIVNRGGQSLPTPAAPVTIDAEPELEPPDEAGDAA